MRGHEGKCTMHYVLYSPTCLQSKHFYQPHALLPALILQMTSSETPALKPLRPPSPWERNTSQPFIHKENDVGQVLKPNRHSRPCLLARGIKLINIQRRHLSQTHIVTKVLHGEKGPVCHSLSECGVVPWLCLEAVRGLSV